MSERVRRDMEKEGISTPEPVEKTEMSLCDVFYFMAFNELDSERTYGEGGLNSIPTSKIRNWADYNILTFEDACDLIYVIRKVDNAVIEHAAERRKKESKKNGNNLSKGVRNKNAGHTKKGRAFR